MHLDRFWNSQSATTVERGGPIQLVIVEIIVIVVIVVVVVIIVVVVVGE